MSKALILEDKADRPLIDSQDARSLAIKKIIASGSFAKAKRLCAFLDYVSKCTLDNRLDEITEQQIGIRVFGRDPGYNSAEDNIVRTTARQLRERLAIYYQEEGASDTIRVRIARGGYVPLFEDVAAESFAPAAITEAEEHETHSSAASPIAPPALAPSLSKPRELRGIVLVAAVAFGALLMLLVDRTLSGDLLNLHRSTSELFWSQIFSPLRTTVFVPGDAGLNLYNVFSNEHQQLSLRDYASGMYEFPSIENLATKSVYRPKMPPYVSFTDLRLADDLTKVKNFRRDHYQVRFPRELSPNDLRNANAIICGAPPYNPWVEMFDERLNFHFVYSSEAQAIKIINRKPISGEPAVYQYGNGPGPNIGWGYVALTDTLDGAGKVLLIEGTTQAGVEAAISFLMNDEYMTPILDAAKRQPSRIGNFEILLQASLIKNSAGKASVTASRFYP